MIEQAKQVAQRLRMMIGWDTTKEAADVIDALVSEVEAVRKANMDCVNHADDCRAECKELRAEVERLQERMDEVIAADDKIIAWQRDEIERLKQVGINGLTEAETDATASVMGLVKQEQTLQAISDIGQLQEQAEQTRSQKLADAGYTRRAKGFGKEVDVEQAEPVALLRQALEALQKAADTTYSDTCLAQFNDAITAIKQHLGEI